MKKMLKILTAIFVIMNTCVFLIFPCQASKQLTVTPRWVALQSLSTAFDFYDNIGEATAVALKSSNASGMNGVIVIYEYQDGEWVYFDSVTGSAVRNSMGMYIEFEGTSGVNYKMEFIVSVLGGLEGTEVIEEVIDERYATCP